MERRATVAVHFARLQLNNTAVKSNWSAEYIGTSLKKSFDCFIAEISSNFSNISFLKCDFGAVNDKVEDQSRF